MENNEILETTEVTTNEETTEEVVNEATQNQTEEVNPELAKAIGELIVVGAGFAIVGTAYVVVKGVKWVAKKVVNLARGHKIKKENEELLTKVLEADAKEVPLDVDVHEFKTVDAD